MVVRSSLGCGWGEYNKRQQVIVENHRAPKVTQTSGATRLHTKDMELCSSGRGVAFGCTMALLDYGPMDVWSVQSWLLIFTTPSGRYSQLIPENRGYAIKSANQILSTNGTRSIEHKVQNQINRVVGFDYSISIENLTVLTWVYCRVSTGECQHSI